MAPPTYTVSDVMTRRVVAVPPDASFKEIVTAMERWKVTALPVLQNEDTVIGVVSEADLLHKEEYRDRLPGLVDTMRHPRATEQAVALTARDLMSRPAVTISGRATLAEAARLMAHRRLKRLPVLDASGRIEGIVSRADLLKVFLRPDETLAAEIRSEVVSPLFGHEGHDVRVAVDKGVVTLAGAVSDKRLIAVAERLAHSVEGVTGVHCTLTAAS
ncbi:CBS domain-containing protein [Streptomyces zhihengii]